MKRFRSLPVFAGLLSFAGLALTAQGAERIVTGLDSLAVNNRRRIQQTVDAVSACGGGRVVIPPGTWPCGSIELKDDVELHLAKDAVLLGSTNRWDYNANDAFPENRWSPGEEWSGGHLVWARCVTNVAITGRGVLDGNGPAFFGDCDEDSRWPHYKYGLKLHPLDREWFRPGWMLAFFRCRNIRLEGVRLANTTAWSCHFRCCDGVDVRDVTVDADRTIANSDGFSIDCTRNVRVADCTLLTGDDGFAIRASCEHAATNFCENIVISNCDISSCCYGIRFGIGTGTIRNVQVVDTRIHEAAAAGFGFTPAWVSNARNCSIEDIDIRNCMVSDCIHPVIEEGCSGDSRVVGVRFENCLFKTLLPSRLNGSERFKMSFVDCERRTIDRFKVRHHFMWAEREIRDKRRVFAEIGGKREHISVVRCRPAVFGRAGVLLLCLDGRNFAEWEKVAATLARYGAHATFFIGGEMDAPAVKAAKALQAAGHSIGLFETSDIQKVTRQADVAYVPVRAYACGDAGQSSQDEKQRLGRFERIRRDTTDWGEASCPVRELRGRRTVSAVRTEYGSADGREKALAAIRRAGAQKQAVSLVLRHVDELERLLQVAAENGVEVLGYDEVPSGKD